MHKIMSIVHRSSENEMKNAIERTGQWTVDTLHFLKSHLSKFGETQTKKFSSLKCFVELENNQVKLSNVYSIVLNTHLVCFVVVVIIFFFFFVFFFANI